MKVSYLGMTGYDGPAPGSEVWPAPPDYCDPGVAMASFERSLAFCEKAEALGFDWISVAEHHYTPYMMTPNPIILAGALTQRIKTAKIAVLGPIVPLCNPVRLAEELAMVDVMSGGRLVVLLLRGTQNEHHTYDTPAERTRSMTQEGIDLILKAWREDKPFSWSGENYRFNAVSVWPRVVQKPNPVVYGSGNSDESALFAAQRRLGMACSYAPPEAVKRWVGVYRTEAARCGWTPTPDHVLYRAVTYLAETDERAEAEAAGHFQNKSAQEAKLQSEMMGGPQLNASVTASLRPLMTKPYLLGGPDTVTRAFEVLRDCGVGVVDMVFTVGSPEQQMNAMELFAGRVLPRIKAWDQSAFPAEASPQLA